MKIKKKDLIRYIIIGVVILIVFGLLIVLLGNNKRDDKKINLNKVSDNYSVEDAYLMSLYKRYNPERELLFSLIGSNINKNYYGYFYRDKKIEYKDLDDVVKNTILFNYADYKTGEFDEINNCYYMTKKSFGVIYSKLFGKDDYKIEYDENYVMDILISKDNICISENGLKDYNKIIDTYMVNAINEDDYITIYERVAFIKIGKDYLYFYRDYKMKDLVYKLKITDKLDRSFINNENVVSNVLLKYQDDFDLYEYTYVKGVDSYYFESIER